MLILPHLRNKTTPQQKIIGFFPLWEGRKREVLPARKISNGERFYCGLFYGCGVEERLHIGVVLPFVGHTRIAQQLDHGVIKLCGLGAVHGLQVEVRITGILQDGSIIESRYQVERRDRTIHTRMREYLFRLKHEEALETAILPVGDGVSISVRK